MQSTRRPLDGFSHVMGRIDTPLIELTLPQLLARTVLDYGDRDAAIFAEQGIRRSYAEFASDVDSLATGLLRLGYGKGDRVGIWSPNRYEWLLTQFATARIGVILVNINPAYRLHELDYALNKVGCAGLITARAFKSSDYTGMLAELGPARLPLLEHIICMGEDVPQGMLAFDEVLAAQNPDKLNAISDSLHPDDPINIQFTSGTTGNPKGATLTHRNIVNNAHFTTEALELTERDRLCIPVPFYHCFGMVMGTLGCVTKGAAMVVPSEGFDPFTTLRQLEAERCTACYGVPTMFVGMLEHEGFGSFDLSNLRTGIMAGAPCPIEVMRAVQSKMHMTGVTIAYGMTETSPVSFQSNIDDPVEKRVTSVGRIHPHVEVKLVHEDGKTVPVGEQGELWTRGYSVMQGYWDEPVRTSETIDDAGWLHSGDLARMDGEGYVNITGRLKDMIVRGGENIYPREIEEFLYTHPAVSQVQVFGVPDDKFGEIAVAWIITKPDQSATDTDIKAFCQGQIAHFKVPAHVLFVDEIPMTVTGKPQKFVMRDAMVERLGLTETRTA
ncbi:MAG: AMP-binding protein [Pseudomonadota bacterium]